METGIKVGDCMRKSLATIGFNDSVISAAKAMKKSGVGSLLVTNKDNEIFGIVTTTDIVRKSVAAGSLEDRVEKICSNSLLSTSPEADISDAAALMGKSKVKRLVVKSSGKVVGMISQRDLVKISPSLYDLIAEKTHFG